MFERTLNARQLSKLLKVSEGAIFGWKGRGCPHDKKGIGGSLFNELEVQGWLEEMRANKKEKSKLERQKEGV